MFMIYKIPQEHHSIGNFYLNVSYWSSTETTLGKDEKKKGF